MGGFLHETNTFQEQRTTYADFAEAGDRTPLTRGPEVLERFNGVNTSIAGALDVLKPTPAGTPKAIIAKLNAEGQKAVRAPEFMKRMSEFGFEVIGGSPEQMRAMIDAEAKRMHPIVRSSGAKPE